MTNQKKVTVEYAVLTDSLGNKVYPGDVLLEYEKGCKYIDGKSEYRMQLWEMIYPFDGHGFNYNIDGSKYQFAWCSVKESIKINFDEFPPEFKFSYYHGMDSFYSTTKKRTAKELIDNSDWKDWTVNPSDVEIYNKKKNLKLESIEDIKENIDLLTGPGATPNLVVDKILDIVQVSPTPMINGEMGYAAVMDSLNYSYILERIKNEMNK